jgi:iron complex outermembrane receptor protein
VWFVAALTTLLGTGAAWAQTGTVRGTVQDHAGVAIAGAEVRIEGTTLHTSSDEAGKYELGNVPAGAHVARALMLGFKSEARSITVEAGATITADFHLERSVIPVKAIEVVVGSRAHHTAADELAVPVDVYNHDVLERQGTTETSQMLQALSPSVNFPRQSVTDATDVVRPFTLRGLSPDQTLVLLNGMRRHQTALVNTFAYGMPAGSSGVDMNAIPASAIDRVEVLRDGAAAQYGSDAIAGVVNVVLRRGRFAPFATLTGGQYFTADYPRDGRNVNVNGGWGVGVGRGSLALTGEYLDRQPTNRAWADPSDASGTGVADVVGPDGKVIQKNNNVPQPNYHWGDGLEKDLLTMGSFNYPLSDHSQLYAFGGYSHRLGNGNGYRRYAGSDRNWAQIYPLGYLPEFRPVVTDYSMAGGWKGQANGWNLDAGATFGHDGFRYDLRNTLNASLGPSLTTPTAPGPDGIFGNSDDPGIPNQTSFFAGELHRDEFVADLNGSKELKLGLPAPVNVALGASWRRERWVVLAGERASWIDGGHVDQNGGDAPGGSQVFAGFSPSDASDSRRENLGLYTDLETNLTPQLLANAAARYEHYSDFGSLVTGKLAARWQPDKHVTFRAAGSNGFRAPGLSQIHFSKVITNFIANQPVDVGVFPVDHPAAILTGSKPLEPEKSINLSAGLAVTPIDALTLAVDAYDIRITDRIILGPLIDDAVSLAALQAAGYGAIQGVQYFINGLRTTTQGFDVTADLRHPMQHSRALDFKASVNWGKNKITRGRELLAGDPVTPLAIERERPDWRGTLSAEYSQARCRGLVRASYFGTFESAQPGFTNASVAKYPGRTLIDAEAVYQLPQVEIAIGARNLFDSYPGRQLLPDNNNGGVFPWAAASPFGYNGRFLYTKATWTLPR